MGFVITILLSVGLVLLIIRKVYKRKQEINTSTVPEPVYEQIQDINVPHCVTVLTEMNVCYDRPIRLVQCEAYSSVN